MENQLVKINPSEYGIEESKAAEISAVFKPMLDKMVELEKEYNEVITLPIESDETALKAKELRLKYVKVRTGTAEIHKTQKDFYLKGGRFIDGWKNAQLFASQGIEEKLESIEKYKQNLRLAEIKRLEIERKELLAPYTEIIPYDIGTLEQSVFDNYLTGVKIAYDVRIKAEKEAEEKRLTEIEAERQRQIAIQKENDRLKKEAEQKEKELAAERAKAESERKALEEKARKEREESERKIKAEQEAARLAAQKAAAERSKLEAELRAKEAAEQKKKEDEEKQRQAEIKAKKDAEKKAANAPDKDKLMKLAESLKSLEFPEVKGQDATVILNDVKTLINKVVTFINDRIVLL